MATRPGTVDVILEQAAEAGTVTARKMFGEYALYCDGTLVALVCDDELFIKPTAAGRRHLGAIPIEERPPYPGAKPCLVIPGDLWEDQAWLGALIRCSAGDLPRPTPRKLKAGTPRRGTRSAP